MIPTYSADGRRLRNYSLHAIEQLLQEGTVTVERNRKGKIVCASFTARPVEQGAWRRDTMRLSAFMGQPYSFREHLPSGHQVWQHAHLLTQRNIWELLRAGWDRREMDAYVREVFTSVQHSVLVVERPATPPPAPAQALVFNIGDFAHRRTTRPASGPARPIEFDSHLRSRAA